MKVFAILNVIAWMGFWAFAYIALTSDDLSNSQLTIAALLAAVGFAIGMFAYIRISSWSNPRTTIQKEG